MKRFDGRGFDALRKIKIDRGFIKYAEGSSLIEMGNTKIVTTATVEKGVPNFLRGKGEGWVTAEYGMLPRATQTRHYRDRIVGRNMEIQRLIARSLRSVINLKCLGERTIWIDCDVIQADGGTRTASIIGGFCAMVDCVSRLYRDAAISSFAVKDLMGAISVGVSKGECILDLTYEEDKDADVDMNVVMRSNGEFVEIQGTGENGTFSKETLDEILVVAKKGINEIIDIERNIFKDIMPNI